MARTKAKNRRGAEGKAYRENAKTAEGRKKNLENKSRSREDVRKEAIEQYGPPPKKKAKKNRSAVEGTEGDESMMQSNAVSVPAEVTTFDLSTSTSNNALPMLTELEKTHDVTTMSIISSSHIQKKVTRALQILSDYPAVPPAKPKVVMLHAKAPVASKMITIAEIVKREVAKNGGKWFQYNKLGQIMEEKKTKGGDAKKDKVGDEGDSMAEGVEDGEGHESEEEFETMKTPFERALEGKPKVRAIPVMTLYLSRVRIDSLKKDYDEQTNGVSTAPS